MNTPSRSKKARQQAAAGTSNVASRSRSRAASEISDDSSTANGGAHGFGDYTWNYLFGRLTCRRHSASASGMMAYGEATLSWEWKDGQLCLYLFGDGVDPPNWMGAISNKIYICSTRKPVIAVENDFHCLGDTNVSIADRVLYIRGNVANPKEHIGKGLVGDAGFYIIHDGDMGAPLPDFVAIGKPQYQDISTTCCLCVAKEDTATSVHEDNSRGAAQPEVIIEGAGRQSVDAAGPANPQRGAVDHARNAGLTGTYIRPVPVPTYEGRAERSEWNDYWGTRYTKYVYPNNTYVRCRDIAIYAGHTPEAVGTREIYPDVHTSLETARLTTTSMSRPCIYTDDRTGRCFYYAGVLRANVIKSRARLISGQCIYHWTSGWSPYNANNVRVCSIVTIGRRIGDYYYHAVTNGSTQYYEMRLQNNNVLIKTEYRSDRQIAIGSVYVSGIEE